MPLPIATLSLDLDDSWAYLRTRGDPDWPDVASILPLAVERLLGAVGDTRITVFVVGRDAQLPEGVRAIQDLIAAGHEIANHSMLHRGELASLSDEAIREDLRRSSDAIRALTGSDPTGFRCPSYGRSAALLNALVDEGYSYDASVLPTLLSPLLKAYYRSRLRSRDGSDMPGLFGPTANALLPLRPFRWDNGLLELPISTMPVLRTPLHMSYLQAIGATSRALADEYLAVALRAMQARGVAPSFLLHPTDVLDVRDAPRLAYFPGMARSWTAKLEQAIDAVALLNSNFEVVSLGEAARRLEHAALPRRALAA